MTGFGVLLGFFSTLIATLIGVRRGFKNDRKLNRINSRNATIQNLRAINSELDRNKELASRNYDVIDDIQSRDSTEVDHYTLEVFSRSAWNTASSRDLSEDLSEDIYVDLQETYSKIQSINEQIGRLRTEILHPDVGKEEDMGPISIPNWSLTVAYWSDDEDKVQDGEFGSVIKNRCNSLKIKISGLNIEKEIERLEKENQKEEAISKKVIRNLRS